jgi:small subunit ribosomal protein S27Ae
MSKRELFKIEGESIVRLRRSCPKCGDGVFLAEHKDRLSCGKCGYTEFKGKQEKPKETPPPEPSSQEETPQESKIPTDGADTQKSTRQTS